MADKEFTIQCKMEERWIPHFLSMLREIEYNGNVGHSGGVAFFADGDGDCRFRFSADIDYERQEPREISPSITFGVMYDAG